MMSIEQTTENPLLRIAGLSIEFGLRDGKRLKALDEVSLSVQPGEVLGLVGESGAGKTVLALSILRLITRPGEVKAGEILWQGKDLLQMPEGDINKVRGRGIAMVFQNAPSSLNPALRIKTLLSGVLKYRRGLRGKEALEEALELLAAVKLPDPQRVLKSYPHELSVGMAQRVAIALALACKPRLLIADEPTSALDATVAVQLAELLRDLQSKFGLAILFISHDMGIVARTCDRVSVMYLGRIVESAIVEKLFHHPLHPYTQALLASVSLPDPGRNKKQSSVISVPSNTIDNSTSQCRFANRCPKVFEQCLVAEPDLSSTNEHYVACWLHAGNRQSDQSSR